MLTELPGPLCSSLLLWLDEGALGALASAARSPSELSADPALWRRLASCRDPRGVWLALGGAFGGAAAEPSSVDWRALCRRLSPGAAGLAWPDAEAAAGSVGPERGGGRSPPDRIDYT
ncbi:unnamed protein product [Prorocentrum cordatum]|uniref:F-box domain-containing protein n=1 Tax=Prorocentrum cordatum TaxID=2364126 RepID=A0ABN9T3G4_9DINO|nr:unnamed protein product [Polarella glacialis]